MTVTLNASQSRALAILHSVSLGGKGDSIPARVVQQLVSMGLADYVEGEYSRFFAITNVGRAVHGSSVQEPEHAYVAIGFEESEARS